ncbi:hypothetical protein HY771_02675 [Candidatus Uhrbacteria bacterium]|nr:hypothetical protein [Candidatus Uhrbacteria bacterium]
MLETILLVIGLVFVIGPTLGFIGVSFYVIKGAMGDDIVIKSLVLLGIAFSVIGAILLLSLYLTNVFG